MYILIFFAAGVIVGWLIRKRPKWIRTANLGSYILLGILIFTMGASIGSRPDVVRDFSNLGLISIALAVGGIFGSLLFLLPLSKKKQDGIE